MSLNSLPAGGTSTPAGARQYLRTPSPHSLSGHGTSTPTAARLLIPQHFGCSCHPTTPAHPHIPSAPVSRYSTPLYGSTTSLLSLANRPEPKSTRGLSARFDITDIRAIDFATDRFSTAQFKDHDEITEIDPHRDHVSAAPQNSSATSARTRTSFDGSSERLHTTLNFSGSCRKPNASFLYGYALDTGEGAGSDIAHAQKPWRERWERLRRKREILYLLLLVVGLLIAVLIVGIIHVKTRKGLEDAGAGGAISPWEGDVYKRPEG